MRKIKLIPLNFEAFPLNVLNLQERNTRGKRKRNKEKPMYINSDQYMPIVALSCSAQLHSVKLELSLCAG